MLNLLRLGRITADPGLEEKAAAIGRAFFENVRQSPGAHTQLIIAVDFAVGPSFEVVITGRPKDDDTENMLKAVRREFVPNKVVLFVPSHGEASGIGEIAPFIANMSPVDDKATSYVCVNFNCKLPTNDVDTMLSMLKSP